MNMHMLQNNPAELALGLSLPTRRVESFHYTDLRSKLGTYETDAKRPSDANALALGAAFPRLVSDAAVLHFYDGHAFDRAEAMPEGVQVQTGAPEFDFTAADINDTLALINQKAVSGGVEIRVDADKSVEQTIGLVHAHSGREGTRAATRFAIHAGADSSSRFIERQMGNSDSAHLSSSLTKLTLEKGAKLEYFIVQQMGKGAEHLGRMEVSLGEDSELTVFVLNAGGKLVRQEVHIAVKGENAELALKGVNLIGNGAHIDVTTVLNHEVPNTNAEELFRNVVAGDGHGVFQGQIKVAQPAQKTDAQMACNTLLLTDDGDFSAKPELEIFADDVICAHGATVADIDDEQLFYLRARGIGEKDARALLIKAFVDEVVEDLEAGELGEALTEAIDTWLDANI